MKECIYITHNPAGPPSHVPLWLDGFMLQGFLGFVEACEDKAFSTSCLKQSQSRQYLEVLDLCLSSKQLWLLDSFLKASMGVKMAGAETKVILLKAWLRQSFIQGRQGIRKGFNSKGWLPVSNSRPSIFLGLWAPTSKISMTSHIKTWWCWFSCVPLLLARTPGMTIGSWDDLEQSPHLTVSSSPFPYHVRDPEGWGRDEKTHWSASPLGLS